METFINFNGKIISSDTPVIHAGNRGFRYGDGLFETLRVKEGRIIFAGYHFERLFSGMNLLQFERPASFSTELLSGQVNELCKKNAHLISARVRLTVFRSDGDSYQPGPDYPDYIIQSSSLSEVNRELEENGLVIGLYPDGHKPMDGLSNVKSNNSLLNSLAVKYAKSHQWGDCLLLNSSGRICETSIANIFCIKNESVHTPPLSEGCIAGVTRRYLLEKIKEEKYLLEERKMDFDWVKDSDEIFLTNSIYGIRWVQCLGNRQYRNTLTQRLYQSCIRNVF